MLPQLQTKPSPTQVAEVQKLLDKIKAARAQGKTEAVKQLRREAVALTKKHYKISGIHAAGQPHYDPALDYNGSAEKQGNKVEVTLGAETFKSPAWLASTQLHELVGHGTQAASGRWYEDAQGSALNEVEAYDLELANAAATGLTNGEINKLKKARQEEYEKLNAANQAKADKGDYTLGPEPEAKHKSNVSLYRAMHHLHKGGLHRALGVGEGEKIPAAKIEAAKHSSNEHVRHMANFASTMEGFSKS